MAQVKGNLPPNVTGQLYGELEVQVGEIKFLQASMDASFQLRIQWWGENEVTVLRYVKLLNVNKNQH